jgi:hypothetical protein
MKANLVSIELFRSKRISNKALEKCAVKPTRADEQRRSPETEHAEHDSSQRILCFYTKAQIGIKVQIAPVGMRPDHQSLQFGPAISDQLILADGFCLPRRLAMIWITRSCSERVNPTEHGKLIA